MKITEVMKDRKAVYTPTEVEQVTTDAFNFTPEPCFIKEVLILRPQLSLKIIPQLPLSFLTLSAEGARKERGS